MKTLLVTILTVLISFSLHTQVDSIRTARLKAEVKAAIGQQGKAAQVMVDKIFSFAELGFHEVETCLLYTSPSPRDATLSRMPSSA